MNVTNDMAEAALDALDDACIGFNRSNPRASVHWKGFTRDDRVAAMRTALSAALAEQDAAIALMRGQSWQSIETAPEEVPADEAVIVCITYDEPRFAGQRMIGEAYKVDGVWWWAGTHPNDYHTDPIEDMYGLGCVTHWQPLPAPPKDPADEQ